MKKLLMIFVCATLLSSQNRAWSDRAQVSSWSGRVLSMGSTGIPGAIMLGYFCFFTWNPIDDYILLRRFCGIFSAIFLLETAYKSSWYFSKPHCDICAANKNSSQKQSVE